MKGDNFINWFQRDCIWADDYKIIMPGLICCVVFRKEPINRYTFHYFIDPRQRGLTFKNADGVTPIMRLDWELSDESIEDMTGEEILRLANIQATNDLDAFESGELTVWSKDDD